MRDDQAGDAEEHQDGLTLIGHQVDVAQRLRDPDQRGQADTAPPGTHRTWCGKYSGRSTPSACAVPALGRTVARAPEPPSGAGASSMADRPPLAAILIAQQNGFAKAKPLNMHNKTLIRQPLPAATLAPNRPRTAAGGLAEGLCTADPSRVISVAAATKATRRPPRRRKDSRHARRPQARICPVCGARQGRSHRVLRGGAEVRAGRPQGARADRRSGAAGGGGRPLHRQERRRARHRRAGRPRRCRGWSSSGSARPASSSRRISSSSAAPRWARFRPPRAEATIIAESAGRRAQAGPGRRHRARRAAARLCVRPLQDQAQGGRGARRPRSKVTIAVADVAGGAARRWPRARRSPTA